jgi:hypothetical protein
MSDVCLRNIGNKLVRPSWNGSSSADWTFPATTMSVLPPDQDLVGLDIVCGQAGLLGIELEIVDCLYLATM